MPKSDNQKLKILYVLDYLEHNSSEDHPVKAAELIAMLQQHDIACERKTIYSDIAALQAYGIDIASIPGKNGGYFIGQRNFELPELKLLISAVQSSRYLTAKKSRELIEKLCKQCSVHEAQLLRRDVLVERRVKSMNESIYYNVDAIQEAICENRQISFRYFNWGIDGKRVFRRGIYEASPYGLCQDNENCYLLALSPRHGVTQYRVDRMQSIQIQDKPRVPCPELTGKALADRARQMFSMYSGESQEVKLRFHRDLTNVVVDRFGRDIMLIPDGEEHFVFTVRVAISPMFLSWVIGFGDKARILYPQSVIDQCQDLCRAVLQQYQAR